MSLRDDVLDRTDIVDLVSRYVDLKKVGKNWTGLCPFHREKSPSFTVAEDKQIFKCFGCGKWGNAITFHMEIERIDFLDSLKILAEQANLDISEITYDPDASSARKETKEKLKYLNKRVQTFFLKNMTNSSAEEYATNTRKLDETTKKIFGLWYAPDAHYGLLQALQEKWFTYDDMIQAGVAKKNSSGDVYAFFRHRLTFPIHDHIGNIVWFGWRALDTEQNPKYLNTTQTPLYDKSKILFGLHLAREQVKHRWALIVVEWYMDVIALHQYGFPLGVATCGTALTNHHATLLKRHTDTIYFAFDNDLAWFEATLRALKIAYAQDLFPKVLQFPKAYKDVDEWLTAVHTSLSPDSDDKSAFLKEHSKDAFNYMLTTLRAQYDIHAPVERKKVMQLCFDVLERLEDRTILSLYLEQMSKAFDIWADMLLQQFKKFLKQRKKTSYDKKEPEQKKHTLEPRFLLACLWWQEFIQEMPHDDMLVQAMLLVESLSQHFPQSLVAKIQTQSLDEQEQQLCMEAQLRREHQLNGLADDKKITVLVRFLKQHIHSLERVVLKSATISDEEKQEIMTQLREMKK